MCVCVCVCVLVSWYSTEIFQGLRDQDEKGITTKKREKEEKKRRARACSSRPWKHVNSPFRYGHSCTMTCCRLLGTGPKRRGDRHTHTHTHTRLVISRDRSFIYIYISGRDERERERESKKKGKKKDRHTAGKRTLHNIP